MILGRLERLQKWKKRKALEAEAKAEAEAEAEGRIFKLKIAIFNLT